MCLPPISTLMGRIREIQEFYSLWIKVLKSVDCSKHYSKSCFLSKEKIPATYSTWWRDISYTFNSVYRPITVKPISYTQISYTSYIVYFNLVYFNFVHTKSRILQFRLVRSLAHSTGVPFSAILGSFSAALNGISL